VCARELLCVCVCVCVCVCFVGRCVCVLLHYYKQSLAVNASVGVHTIILVCESAENDARRGLVSAKRSLTQPVTKPE
jgi:hypothetical protein